jgi:hypothetical protein
MGDPNSAIRNYREVTKKNPGIFLPGIMRVNVIGRLV